MGVPWTAHLNVVPTPPQWAVARRVGIDGAFLTQRSRSTGSSAGGWLSGVRALLATSAPRFRTVGEHRQWGVSDLAVPERRAVPVASPHSSLDVRIRSRKAHVRPVFARTRAVHREVSKDVVVDCKPPVDTLGVVGLDYESRDRCSHLGIRRLTHDDDGIGARDTRGSVGGDAELRHDDLMRRITGLVCAVVLLSSLVGCSDDEPQAGNFCDAAETVRTANLSFADELGAAEPWDQKRPAVGEAVEELQRALEDLPTPDDLLGDVQLWKSDLDALSGRVAKSESVEEFLYEQESDRPSPDELNPGLERIDATFEADCGFAARS